MEKENIKIERLEIDSLKPYENNAKSHPEKQIDQIVESIRRFGMIDPIGIWSEENIIIEDAKPDIRHMKKAELQELLEEIYSDKTATTVIYMDKPAKNAEHPTMKPVKLFDYEIRNSTKKGQNVLDLFGGSGTTIIACEQNGRNGYVMEFDPAYVDVIVDRWEKFTGQTAQLLEE